MDDINKILLDLKAEDNLRSIQSAVGRGRIVEYNGVEFVNMASNDYLGLSGNLDLQEEFLQSIPSSKRFLMSNPSSRLMTGNSSDYGDLEDAIGAIYKNKSALVLSSGYMVNSGVLPALTSKDDLVIADKLVHASIIDGLRLCQCKRERFNHNDVAHLERIIEKNRSSFRNIWVVVESIYSMDGDTAPVQQLVALKKKYDLRLYIDEAHAFGVRGHNGGGIAQENQIDQEFDIIVATFGKAVSSCGAFVAAEPKIRELLINRMRTIIFSTALPPINLMWTKFIVERLDSFDEEKKHLRNLINILVPDTPEATHIMPIMTYENSLAIELSDNLKECGFWVTPIRYPTVAKGKARVRISLTAALTQNDMLAFCNCKNAILERK